MPYLDKIMTGAGITVRKNLLLPHQRPDYHLLNLSRLSPAIMFDNSGGIML